MDVTAMFMLTFLAFIIFICFVIYFVFKMLEFVIGAINLYEKMVNRQDVMIKLLKQLRDATLGKEVSETEDLIQENAEEIEWRGYRYKTVHDTKGEAFCISCRTIDEASKLFFCAENDTYIHPKCADM